VTDDGPHLQGLREICAQASLVHDGTVPGVFMPRARLQTPGGTEVMDVMLCPNGLGGYSTRLLLDRRVAGKEGLNWQEVTAFGRLWQTWSWQNVPSSQPWVKIFAEHARVLR
jgi:hypothetical protein